jgi:hypothetical protein
MTANVLTLFKGIVLLILSYIGIMVTYSNGLMIHVKEGSPGWYILLAVSFVILVKGIHNIYTFIRRRLRFYHLNLLRQKRKNQRNARTNTKQ